MRVLVLGSEGQIGSALTRRLASRGHFVDHWDVSINRIQFDLTNKETSYLLARKMQDADFVFFLAWDVGGSKYLAERQGTTEFLSNNLKILETFNRAYSYARDEAPPFIFASSQMSNMMHSQYGVTKRLGEFYTSALGGVNVRFWNVYGNETDPEKFHVVTDFLNMAMSGEDVHMRTDGKEQRQMLHADDAARALEALMVNFDDLDLDKYYDITSFEWVNILGIGALIAFMYGVQLVAGVSPDDVQRDSRNEPDDEILKYWSPEIELVDGIQRVATAMEQA